MNISRCLHAPYFKALATAMLVIGAPSGLAATSIGTLTVTAQVANSCTIGNATLDFGTYSSVTGATKATTANVNCTLLAPYTLTMDQGQHASGSSNRMKATVGGQDYFIPYSATFVGTVSVAGVASLSGVGTGVAVPTAITGSAPAGANVPAASYSDAVLMTVSF